MTGFKKRVQFIDMIKGIAVLAVVFYHLTAPSLIHTVAAGLCSPSLFAFFALSGYFFTPGKRTLAENLSNRTKSLMIPFFKYSLLFWVIGTIIHLIRKSITMFEALCCLRNFYIGCIWNRVIQDWFSLEYYKLGSRYMFLADFWFLLALFLASILFFLLADKVMGSGVKEGISIVVLLAVSGVLRGFAVSLPYNLQLTPFWTACMLAGAIAKERDVFNLSIMKGAAGWILSIVLTCLSAGVCIFSGYGANLFRGTFDPFEPLTMLILFVCGAGFTWGLGTLCKLIEDAGTRVTELAWFGSHSLYIYLFHMLYGWLISVITGFPITYKDEITDTTVAISLVIAVVSLGLSILTALVSDVLAKNLKEHWKTAT